MRGRSASRVSVEIRLSLLKFVETYLRFCSELRKVVVEETAAKEPPRVAYTSIQKDYIDLEGVIVAACQEAEGEGGLSNSSLISRLRSLGDRVAE